MKLQDLQEINEKKLKMYLEQKKNNNNSKLQIEIERKIEIHSKIKNLINKYEALFFQISMVDSFKILSKLVQKEEIKRVYAELISAENYKMLRKNNNGLL